MHGVGQHNGTLFMKHVRTLIDAPDELSRAGVLGLLAGARYKPVVVKGGWEAVVASGKALPEIVILVLSGVSQDLATVSSKIESIAKRSKVIVLSDSCDASLVRQALCAGGSAFLPRSIAADTLRQALNLALDGKVVVPSEIVHEVFSCGELDPNPKRADGSDVLPVAPQLPGRLSPRETDILKRLVHGESNKEICRQFDISETTVKVHVKAILRKIRVRNRTQAAVWGLDHLPAVVGASLDGRSDPPTQQATLSPTGYPAAA
jgi:two-component system nitrate/nitrite response regulator NarL